MPSRQDREARQERAEQQRFFNQPDAEADFDYWGKAAFWHPDEAVALSLGKNPDVVDFNKVNGLRYVSPFAREYEKTFKLVIRAVIAFELPDPIPPSVFFAWAKRIGVQYPAKLEKAVPAPEDQAEIAGPKVLTTKQVATKEEPQKPLTTRERDTLLKIIIGMAIKGYSYDPRAMRSPTAKEIADDISGCGLSVDEDTVRKWLKEAKDILPGDDALPKT